MVYVGGSDAAHVMYGYCAHVVFGSCAHVVYGSEVVCVCVAPMRHMGGDDEAHGWW